MMKGVGQPWRLALRLLRREWRSGEVVLLAAAVVLAVATTSAIALFSDRLQQAMGQQSAELLGGDLLLRSPQPLPEAWQAEAQRISLAVNRYSQFPTMVAAGDSLRLAMVKGVEAGYPLRGRIGLRGRSRATIPAAGEVWLAVTLAESLQVHEGSEVEIGSRLFRVGALIEHDRAGGGGWAAFAPALLMNRADLATSGVVNAASRIEHLTLFAGEAAALQRYREWLTPQLDPTQRLLGLDSSQPRLVTTLKRATLFLHSATLLALLLAGVAIALAVRRYSERHFDAVALVRTLGLTRGEAVQLFWPQILLLGVGSAGVGVVLGWGIQMGLLALLEPLLDPVSAGSLPAARWQPALLSGGSGLLVLLVFALGSLIRLGRVTPLRVLRRDLEPLPLQGWLLYLLALVVMIVVSWLHTADLTLTLTLIFGGGACWRCWGLG